MFAMGSSTYHAHNPCVDAVKDAGHSEEQRGLECTDLYMQSVR